MKLVVGSTALNHAGLNWRKAKDFDIWISKDETLIETKVDSHIIPIELIQLVPVFPNTNIATPNAVYTIKCSHLGWNIKWEKHKSDVIYLKSIGCSLIPELYNKLVKYWETVHGDKTHLSLNKSKTEFFDDFVNHEYDHDLLHEIVARPNKPIYESVLKNGQQVLIDRNKFLSLSKNQQINMFREEIKVIALERYLIPSKFKIGILKAYLLSLKKTITNLTKNWATQFIVENLYEFSNMENDDWVNNFREHIGEIKMNRPEVIEKLKIKAEELEISDGVIEDVFLMGNIWCVSKEGAIECGKEFEKFGNFLEELNFKHLNKEGGGEGGTEYCESVIELDGQAYKLSYSYFSHNGYDIDDVWDWKPVVAKQKTVTYYE